MTTKQKTRWMALISAIDIIETSCEKYCKDFNTIDIKPSALKKYIDTMAAKFEDELCYNDKPDMNNNFFKEPSIRSFAYSD